MLKGLKVYVAAPWICGGDANKLAKQLKGWGCTVTSRWLRRSRKNLPLDYDYNKDKKFGVKECREEAVKDLADIRKSDCLVVLNQVKSEGKVFEQGYATALDIPIIIIGEKTNVFHSLSNCTVFGRPQAIKFALGYVKRWKTGCYRS